MLYYEHLTGPIRPEHLDDALSLGYYRMAQMIHTDSVIMPAENVLVPVYWLRIRLEGPEHSGTQRKALRWLAANFTIRRYQGQLISAEVEALYHDYKQTIDFGHQATTARSYLMGLSTDNHYPTRTLLVRERDTDRLVAVGYYDEGATANAGILNFYHPDYQKQSLGRAMYFLALRMAILERKIFFYPGYIGRGFTRFDYKAQHISNPMELYDMETGIWWPFNGDLEAYLAGMKGDL